MHDFGQALLAEIINSPTICGDDADTAIVFVAHSMGGLVVKKTVLQARRDPNCLTLCKRIHSMFFLATPHRGSDSAQLLKNLLSLASSKSYVGDLQRGSANIQLINDEFRNAYQNIQLWSFFETLPTTGLGIVVDRDSAVLELPGEHIQLMNANHRNVCKFVDRQDSNYLSLRNAFVSSIDTIKKDWVATQRKLNIAQLQTVSDFLGISEGPEADLTRLGNKQTPGTCQWLTESPSFLEWSTSTKGARLFWLEGEPATGKSTIAGHVIQHLEQTNNCAYFFFKHGDSTKSSVASCLLSLAWQMARASTEVRAELLLMAEQGSFLDRADEASVWRSLFQMRILKLDWRESWYWVLDALDECGNHITLLPFLAKLQEDLPLRILVTSRPVLAIDRAFQNEGLPRTSQTVAISQSLADIELFLATNSDFLPVENDNEKQKLLTRILNRSNGNFLWTSLVLQELADTPSVQQAYEVLDSVPNGMEGLYARILRTVMNHPRNSRLALAILKWSVCVTRPLTVEELKEALKLDLNDSFPRLEQTISSVTGNLVVVDPRSRVQLAHQTVRAYLMQRNAGSQTNPEFAIVKTRDHLSLSNTCLNYLCGPELKAPRHRRSSANSRSTQRSPFLDYAAAHFSDHVVRSSAQDMALFNKLHTFFTTNVSTWIEIIASQKSLRPIILTARNLKTYLGKMSKYMAPLDHRVRDLKSWATDLSYLVTSFGKPLLLSPHSIHFVIPPICPPTSMIHRASLDSGRGFRMHGLDEQEWDDRVGCLVQPGTSPFVVTSRDEKFAIGFSDGNIHIHDSSTMQQIGSLDHKEHVRFVAYSKTGKLFATGSRKSIKMWDVEENSLRWQHRLKDPLLCMSFTNDSSHLVTASRGNELMRWDATTSALISSAVFSDIDESTGYEMNAQRMPLRVEYSPEMDVLAVVYRQRPVVFWDLEDDKANPVYMGSYNKDTEAYPGPLNFAMAFNPVVQLIAASYDDGDIVVVNPFSQGVQARTSEDSGLLRASKDGEILASTDGEGTITLFEFETLRRLYRILSYPLNIRDLDFSTSGIQILEVRGDHCNVWQPAALVRNVEFGDESGIEASEIFSEDRSQVPITFETKVYDDSKTITATAISDNDVLFCGREDGSITILTASTGSLLQELEAYSKQVAVAILSVSDSGKMLVTVDRSGRVLVLEMNKAGTSTPVVRLDRRASDVVVQILISPNEQRLLVSTNQRDELWYLDSEEPSIYNRAAYNERCHWMLHPFNKERLLLLEGKHLCWSTWDMLQQSLPPNKFDIAEEGLNDSIPTAFFGNRSVPQLCVTFAPHKDSTAPTKLHIWDGLKSASSSSTNVSERLKSNKYDALVKDIKYAIGFHGSSFFFLTHGGWVCSLETSGGRARTHYSRHFFIPFRFHSNASGILIHITVKKDVLLAYQSNVLIFSGALGFEERVAIDEKAVLVRPSMRSTLGRNRTSPI